VSGRLADRLALAILAHGPLSANRLVPLVAVRREDVLAVLRDDPMFERTGVGRSSRWHYAGNREQAPWEPQGTEDRPGSVSDDGGEVAGRLRTLEARVAELERLAGVRA
jgi:hypothetical protein